MVDKDTLGGSETGPHWVEIQPAWRHNYIIGNKAVGSVFPVPNDRDPKYIAALDEVTGGADFFPVGKEGLADAMRFVEEESAREFPI